MQELVANNLQYDIHMDACTSVCVCIFADKSMCGHAHAESEYVCEPVCACTFAPVRVQPGFGLKSALLDRHS